MPSGLVATYWTVGGTAASVFHSDNGGNRF